MAEKEINISSLTSNLDNSITNYTSVKMPENYDKVKAIQILSREYSIIAAEQKRKYDQDQTSKRNKDIHDELEHRKRLEDKRFEMEKNFGSKRLELDKAKQKSAISIEKDKLSLDKKRFNMEEDISKKRYELDKAKQESSEIIEKLRLDVEMRRVELEKENLEFNKQRSKDDKKYRYIQLAMTIGIPAITSVISLFVYRKLAYSNLKLIYVDEGRPTADFKDSIKDVKKLIK